MPRRKHIRTVEEMRLREPIKEEVYLGIYICILQTTPLSGWSYYDCETYGRDGLIERYETRNKDYALEWYHETKREIKKAQE